MTDKNNGKNDRTSREKSKSNIRQMKDLLANLPTELRLFTHGSLIHFQKEAMHHRWIIEES